MSEMFRPEDLELRDYNEVQVEVAQRVAEALGKNVEQCVVDYSDLFREFVRGNAEIAEGVRDRNPETIDAIVAYILERANEHKGA